MSDKVHTAPDPTPSVSDVCCAVGGEITFTRGGEVIGVLPPQPDEWNRLDLRAELERIERNAAKWEPHPANLIGQRMKADLATVLAVLRRADSVIHAQAYDLAGLRAELATHELSSEAITEAIQENEPTPIILGPRRRPLAVLNPDEVLL